MNLAHNPDKDVSEEKSQHFLFPNGIDTPFFSTGSVPLTCTIFIIYLFYFIYTLPISIYYS